MKALLIPSWRNPPTSNAALWPWNQAPLREEQEPSRLERCGPLSMVRAAIAFSDGTKASFEGRASQVWGSFALTALLGHLFWWLRTAIGPLFPLALLIVLKPVSAAIWLRILRWFCSNVELNQYKSLGKRAAFVGSYGGFVGWWFLFLGIEWGSGWWGP